MKRIFRNIYENLFGKKPLDSQAIKEASKRGFPELGFLGESLKDELEIRLKINIDNTAIFEQALTHRSYLQVLPHGNYNSNERLEFLGDAVLSMIVTDYLFANHINEAEGSLTKLRSMMVNRYALANCAHELELEKFLRVSHGAEKNLKSGSDSMMSDAVEAIIAAVYLDSGYNAATDFVVKVLIPIIIKSNLFEDNNYKSQLLEAVQKDGKKAPTYQVLEETGPPHNKEFRIGVVIDGEIQGTGSGKNKKEAEQKAAMAALENLSSKIQ
ncbi:MAG: ribonuclease III [Candidatus Kapabacteria bacterium]|nr:ribonuclease III [Ignavibacteriota bacterium]MCW5885163.1 ribonuclease III [Candidatus Kapabacteria bacterium]